MSGIVGIVNFDGAPVDRALLRRMTDFMTFRGPDEQRIWIDGNVGFGHTLLRTTFESEHEHQPFTLDGRTWIVADARVDAQADLIAKLAARGEEVKRGVTDVELLLRAYHAWDEDCVDHLLGDFAFAIWDGLRRRLFCARDHLGVKPFFYAHLGQTVIFSNTLDCVRQHPAVSDTLNDTVIADFLLFGVNQNRAKSSFVDIQRLPPAFRATWSGAGLQMTRYWSLPIDEPIRFRRTEDYIDRFKDLLDTAVSDRLRTDKVAVFMSGGVDSPTLAATACEILRRRSQSYKVQAFTTVVDGLDKDERHYANLVAEHLKIPIHFRYCSPTVFDSDWDKAAIHTPEPVVDPTDLLAERLQYQSTSAQSRVVFYGEGPDNALHYEWKPYLSHLLRQRTVGQLVADIGRHIAGHRRVPLLSTVPHLVREWLERDKWRVSFPNWLNADFEHRMKLRDRWEGELDATTAKHPVRPAGYGSFQFPLWDRLFRGLDAAAMAAPLETRHPFLDLELLRYMLAVPAIPWCRNKYLERKAMRGVLPDSVLRRAKSPLTSDPTWETMRGLDLRSFQPVEALAEYVSVDHIPRDPASDVVQFELNFRPWALNYWLENMRLRPVAALKEELENEFVTKHE